jgi:hypothetical protein
MKHADSLARLNELAQARAELGRVVADSDRLAPGQAMVIEPLLLLAAVDLELGDFAAARASCRRILTSQRDAAARPRIGKRRRIRATLTESSTVRTACSKTPTDETATARPRPRRRPAW